MNKTLHAAIMCALIAAGQGIATPGIALAQETAVRSYRIPAGDLDGALRQYAALNRLQLVYSADLVRGKRSAGLSGSYSREEALERLLSGSGLRPKVVNDKTIGLVPDKSPPPSPRGGKGKPASVEPEAAAEPPRTLGTIAVTGTRIRGGTTPSPVITIDSEQIREEGQTDLGEVIRNVTQNFRGGQNPGVGNGSAANLANQNTSGGSSLNLRGLGPDASLTLLNGRRMSYGGFSQSIDISAIPIDAVDRVEIVTDGASAVYGSDAIGGVANVILKRDFDGAALSARYGGATSGGMSTREVTVTGGTTWRSGGLIATYKQSSADAIHASQRSFTEHLIAPRTIYPEVELKSALISAHQSFGKRVELSLDAFKTDRDHTHVVGYGAFHYLYPLQTTTSFVAPGLEISLAHDWSLSLSATRGRDEVTYGSEQIETGTGQLLSASSICYCNESRSYEAGFEGPLFALGGGDARLAVGAGYRENDFVNRSITGTARYGGGVSSRFAYAEISLPLIGKESGLRWMRRLEMTGAVRNERYSSFEGVTTPKLGVVYGPSDDFTFRATWGKSFKAPTLVQHYGIQQAILFPPAAVGGSGFPADATVLYVAGGNPDLGPERARTWTTSIAFHPSALPGLEAELTWFDIDYTDRVVRPIPDYSQAMNNPIYAEFINYSPSQDEQATIIAIPESYGQFYNFSGLDYDPANVVAAINGLYVNATGQRVKGLDLSGSYRVDLRQGRLVFRGSLSWLDSIQQTTQAQQPFDLSGTLFNPPRLNGRLGAVWTQGGFTASLFSNYTGGVTDTVASRKTGSFTTFDAVLRYATQDGSGPWSDMEFALSAQNLLDRDPPLYFSAPATSYPFDSTNYSAIGQFVSISVSKHW